jgi:hypothetical protein
LQVRRRRETSLFQLSGLKDGQGGAPNEKVQKPINYIPSGTGYALGIVLHKKDSYIRNKCVRNTGFRSYTNIVLHAGSFEH